MMRTRWLLPLGPAVLLLASCGSGTQSEIDDTSPSLPPPMNGVTGIATKGVISGATVTVTDAEGAEYEIREGGPTDATGQYRLTFAEATVAAGITAPLTVTVTGGSTVCDVDLPDTNDDCAIDDDVFVPFGESFALPDEFSLQATIDSVPTTSPTGEPVFTVNVSPASDLATRLAQRQAAGTALTRADVSAATHRVLTLIEHLSGIDMSEASLTEEQLFDISALDETTDEASDASYALLAFAIIPLVELDPDDTDVDTLAEVMARLDSDLSVSESGELIATGTALSRFSDSMATALATINAQLATRDAERPGLIDAQSIARNNVATFAQLGDDDVVIAADAASPVQLTSRFVDTLGRSVADAATTGITRSGDVITDGTVSLAIERDDAGRTHGTFTVGTGAAGTRTATLDTQGVVHYADGSFETLPADIE